MKEYKIIKGEKNILVSAPHAILHTRDGIEREGESGTKELVINIAEINNIHGMYKSDNIKNDANWDEHSEYRNKLVNYVRANDIVLVLDLHCMASWRNEDICIGVASYKNVQNDVQMVSDLVKEFENNGFNKVKVDKPFSASFPNCVSSTVSKYCNIPAIQIEINSKYTCEGSETYDFKKIEKAISGFISGLQ